MYCIACGEKLEENAKSCKKCGKVVTKEKKFTLSKKNINIILNCIGIFLGGVMIIISLSSSFSGNTVIDKMYGGDAYTGMQNAMADAANNIDSVADGLEFTVRGFGTVSGLLVIIHYIKALLLCLEKNK